ncbi:MAG: hypothetical protein K2O88_09125, partial [Paramuribaculum sp.]|nr:hypothetical protein [Paramuribaculum sp.]
KRAISCRLKYLFDYAECNKIKLQQIKDKLSSLGFGRERYYLLMQGHIVWNSLVKEFLQKEIFCQRKSKIAEIRKHPNSTQRDNQIRQYCKLTCIDEFNRHLAISERIEQLSNDFASLSQVSEGFYYLQQDLTRLFGR